MIRRTGFLLATAMASWKSMSAWALTTKSVAVSRASRADRMTAMSSSVARWVASRTISASSGIRASMSCRTVGRPARYSASYPLACPEDCSRTKEPRPGATSIRCWASSRRSTSRTTFLLEPNWAASSRSEGSFVPTAISPDLMSCSS